MSYSAKILGTKYVVELQLHHDQWELRLKMGGNTEDFVMLNQLTRKDLRAGINDLVSKMQMQVNPFQREKILEDLIRDNPTIFTNNPSDYGRKVPETTSNPMTQPLKATPDAGQMSTDGRGRSSNSSKSKGSGRSAAELQNTLISEYKSKIREEDKVEVKQISITEFEPQDNDKSQLEELVRSHKEVQKTLKQLDARVAALERLTMKIVEVTDILLDNQF